jgi:uracil-DNA glycosylase
MNISKESYSKYDTWNSFYEKHNSIKNSLTNVSWNKLFKEFIFEDARFSDIENALKELVNKQLQIYPLPSHVFNAFNITSLDDLKVVIIGQDPYFNCEYYNKKVIPQATGLSFSVPSGFNIPSSLRNIFMNQLKFNQMYSAPKSGDLTFWACQGCLMLNTALTVVDNQKNCHSKMWRWVTDMIIKYISDQCEYVVFVVWGSPAYSKINLIDLDKHDAIISSHPSGLSANKGMKNYSSFNGQDHFGLINTCLEKHGKSKILWQL